MITNMKLTKRNGKEPKRKPVKDVVVGDNICVKGINIVVYQIDKTNNGYCFVDKYADDYKVSKTETVEIVEEREEDL